jgi:hypothetical protein
MYEGNHKENQEAALVGSGPMITVYHAATALGWECGKPGVMYGAKPLMLKFRHAGVLKHKA